MSADDYRQLARQARQRRDAYLEREPTPSNTAAADRFEAEAKRYEALADAEATP